MEPTNDEVVRLLRLWLVQCPTGQRHTLTRRQVEALVASEGSAGNPPCQGCGGPHPFDTSVSSAVWNRVIRAANLPDYLCATCIIAAFVRANTSFCATLWGDQFDGTVVPAIEVRVNSQPPRDAEMVSEENNALRVRVRELEDAALSSPSAPAGPVGCINCGNRFALDGPRGWVGEHVGPFCERCYGEITRHRALPSLPATQED